jgi:hypothetical protein
MAGIWRSDTCDQGFLSSHRTITPDAEVIADSAKCSEEALSAVSRLECMKRSR